MLPIKFSARNKFHLVQGKTRTLNVEYENISHYRFIYIRSGEGKFILNNEILSYFCEGVIILEPNQKIKFQEDAGTEVLTIAFDTYLSADYQQKKKFAPDFAECYKQFENLCKDIRLNQGTPVNNDRDSQIITYLTNQISIELAHQPASFIKFIQSSIEIIVTILSRNNSGSLKCKNETFQGSLAESLVKYLQDQLQQNKTVRIGALLEKFSMTEDTANLYMLNHTGMPLRKFVFKYKADLFKSRMLKMDISELSSRT